MPLYTSIITNTAPVDTTKAAAVVGTSEEAARQDHKHNISTATAVSVGTATEEGASTSLARADHVHTGLTRGSADFNGFAAKTVPVGADVVLIEDSAATFAKKKTTIQQIRDSMGGVPLQSSYVGLASDVSTTSAYSTYVGIPGMSTTIVTTKVSSILRLELTACFQNSTTNITYFRIKIDGILVKGTAGTSRSTSLQSSSLTFHHTVSAGSHPVILEWCNGGGTTSCNPVTDSNYHHCSLLVQELA